MKIMDRQVRELEKRREAEREAEAFARKQQLKKDASFTSQNRSNSGELKRSIRKRGDSQKNVS
jgi:hypothetical protein